MTGKFSDDMHINNAVPEYDAPQETADTDATEDYAAVRVHVESTSVDSRVYDIPYTVTVQAGQSDTTLAVRELVPADILRVRYTVISIDNPVVISRSIEEAQSDANTQTEVNYPSGALLDTGQKLQLAGNNQMWVAATVNTVSRVLVVVERAESA